MPVYELSDREKAETAARQKQIDDAPAVAKAAQDDLKATQAALLAKFPPPWTHASLGEEAYVIIARSLGHFDPMQDKAWRPDLAPHDFGGAGNAKMVEVVPKPKPVAQ